MVDGGACLSTVTVAVCVRFPTLAAPLNYVAIM